MKSCKHRDAVAIAHDRLAVERQDRAELGGCDDDSGVAVGPVVAAACKQAHAVAVAPDSIMPRPVARCASTWAPRRYSSTSRGYIRFAVSMAARPISKFAARASTSSPPLVRTTLNGHSSAYMEPPLTEALRRQQPAPRRKGIPERLNSEMTL
jgi:hypothetical protein